MEFSPGDRVWVKRSNGLWWPALVEEQALTPNGKNRKRKREGAVTVKYPFEEESETVPDRRRIKAFDCTDCHQLVAGPDSERSSRRRSSTYDANLFHRAVGALLQNTGNKLADNDTASTDTTENKPSDIDTSSADTSEAKNARSTGTADTSEATESIPRSAKTKPATPRVAKSATPKVSKPVTPKVSKPASPKVSTPTVKATPPNRRRNSRSKPSTPSTPQQHSKPVTDQENKKPGENEKLKSVILDEPRVPTIGLMLPLFEADLPDITPSKRSRADKSKSLKRRVRSKVTVTSTPLMRRESSESCEKAETVVGKRRSRSRSSSAGQSLRSTNSTDGDGESMAETSNDEKRSRMSKSRSRSRSTNRSFPLSDGACDLKSLIEEKKDEPVGEQDEKKDETGTTKSEASETETAGKSDVNLSDEPRTPGACGESFLCPSQEEEEEEEEMEMEESDDDDDLPVFSSQSPSKFQGACFQRGDIVWAKCLKFPPWPAVVRTVYKKRGRLDKVSVFFIGDPCTRGQNGFRFKYHPNKMKYFCTEEGNTLESRDDPVVMAVVNRVDDYLTKKALGKTQLNPFEHFKMSDVEEAPVRDDNDDDVNVCFGDVTRARPDDVIESVTLSDTEDESASEESNLAIMPDKVERELSRCAARTQKLVDFILSEDCTSYARDVIRGEKDSQLHREFDPADTSNVWNFGPMEDEDQLFEVYGHLMRTVEEDGSIPSPHRHAYVSAVLAPECIVLAMRRVTKYSGPRAWALFNKGPQHSRALLQYEHDSILASAERIPEKERIRHRELMQGRCQRLMEKFNINMAAI